MFSYFRALRRLDELEEQVEKLRREHRTTLLEAESLYEKTRHLMGRIAKRTAAAASEAPSDGDGAEVTNGGPPADRWAAARSRIFGGL